MPGDDLDPALRAAALATVEGFVRRAVAPHAARPEVVLDPPVLARLDADARDAGLLPSPDGPGLALWGPETPDALSLAMLRIVARASAGLAYRFHRRALRAAANAALDVRAPHLLILDGPAPLAKGALAAWLHGRPCDTGLLEAAFALPGATLFTYGDGEGVVAPCWRDGITWRRWTRDTSEMTIETAPHGLQEAGLKRVHLQGDGEPRRVADAQALYLGLAGADALASVAVALGAVEHALEAAGAYANTRRQGGALIAEHAAIRLLLGGAKVSANAAGSLLAAPAPARGTVEGFEHAITVRAAALPLLCAAANDCMQVLGGYGYMQDYGLEKIVRDCNALRGAGPGTGDLRLHFGAPAVTP